MRRAIRIILRVDGNKWIGMGHIYRTIILLDKLKEISNIEALFVVKNSYAALKLLEERGYASKSLSNNISKNKEREIFKSLVSAKKPDIVIIDDLNFTINRKTLKSYGKNNKYIMVALCDETNKKKINADIVFCFNPNQKPDYYRAIKNTRYYLGLKYYIAAASYSSEKKRAYKVKRRAKNILVCMGGSDRRNITYNVLKAIGILNTKYSVKIVLSSMFFSETSFERIMGKIKHSKVSFIYDSNDLCRLFKEADIAITSGGNIHIDRMITGVPGMVIGQSKRENEITKSLARAGAVINVGQYDKVGPKKISNSLASLTADYKKRKEISKNSMSSVDGLGASRMAKIIIDGLSRK